jgi:outer membrane protein TolC
LLAALACRAAADPAPLRVEDVVAVALKRSERARIADLNVVVADATVARARTAFLPVLTASGNEQLRGASDPTSVTTGQLALNQPLLNPSAFPLYAQSKDLLESTRAQSMDDQRQLAFDAARAFFVVLLADEVVQAAQRKLETARANVNDTEARGQAALVSSNDVSRAQIDVGASERELAGDQGSLEAAYVQLAFTINAPVARALAPPTTLLAAGKGPVPPIDDLVALARRRRPDLAAHRYAAAAAHDFASEPMLRLVPTIGLAAAVSATSNPPLSGRSTDETLALTATWTLFDAGVRYADQHAREATAEIADLNTELLARTVDSQVRSAAALLTSAQTALSGAEKAMTAARQSADETSILYRQGLAKAIELVDANEQRFAAEVNDATAEFTVATAYLALRQALGLDPIGTELK